MCLVHSSFFDAKCAQTKKRLRTTAIERNPRISTFKLMYVHRAKTGFLDVLDLLNS